MPICKKGIDTFSVRTKPTIFQRIIAYLKHIYNYEQPHFQ